MPLVVADAGPLHYLVLTGDIELLPKLFERVLVPQVVRDELANAEADFDKALKLAPGDAYAQSGRADVYQRQNKPVPEERSTGLSFDNLRRMVEQPSEAAAK